MRGEKCDLPILCMCVSERVSLEGDEQKAAANIEKRRSSGDAVSHILTHSQSAVSFR